MSVVLLALLIGAYTAKWITDLRPTLVDPTCQTDDVRVGLAAFHRFDNPPSLVEDPLTADLYLMYMPAVRLLYRIVVPFTGLPVAAKIMQGLALGMIALAAFILMRSRRAGLAAGVLLLFLAMHEWYIIDRIAGGLGRAFIFPFLLLWFAGAVTKNERLRAIVALLASISQANAAIILLLAEGLLYLLDLGISIWRKRKNWRFSLQDPVIARGVRLTALGVLCVVLASTYTASVRPQIGSFPTFEQASKNPAFIKGNYWENELPFPDGVEEFERTLASPLKAHFRPGANFLSKGWEKAGERAPLVALGLFVVLALIFARRQAAIPLAFLAASVACYVAAKELAFRLYSPERYYAFGGPMTTIAVLVIALGCTHFWLKKKKWRSTIQNYVAAGFIILLWMASGRTGMAPSSAACVISEKPLRPLYDFLKTLPPEIRIMAHPHDSDDIPWWAGRATTGGFEMCMVWFVDAHQRCIDWMNNAVRAYYAIDRGALYKYLEQDKITHILIHKDRLGPEFAKKSRVAEPIQTTMSAVQAGKASNVFVLNYVPQNSIIFRFGQYEVVDVEKMKAGWGAP